MTLKTVFAFSCILTTAFCYDPAYKEYNSFLQKYVCQNGVAYIKIIKDTVLTRAVMDSFSNVSKKEFDAFSESDKIAFIINLYNFYTIVLIKNNYPTESIRSIKNPWRRKFVPLRGELVSLDYLEHELLRKQFNEPRIHFALVCASLACPPLSNTAYTGAKLDQQLNVAAKAFLNDKTRNRVENSTLFLSKIFEWFGDDFKQKYGGYKNYVVTVLGLKGKYSVTFLDYDWSLNEVSNCHGE